MIQATVHCILVVCRRQTRSECDLLCQIFAFLVMVFVYTTMLTATECVCGVDRVAFDCMSESNITSNSGNFRALCVCHRDYYGNVKAFARRAEIRVNHLDP